MYSMSSNQLVFTKLNAIPTTKFTAKPTPNPIEPETNLLVVYPIVTEATFPPYFTTSVTVPYAIILLVWEIATLVPTFMASWPPIDINPLIPY